MTPNRRGISLVEVVVAMTLLVAVSAGTASLFSKLSKTTKNETDTQLTRLNVGRSLGELKKDVYNAALLSPREGLDTAKDGLYSGLVALSSNSSHKKDCQHEADGAGERFSILRYTTLLNNFSPEKTLKGWRDTDTKRPLRVSYHAANTGTQYLFQGSKQNASEVILIDADLTNARRYGVESVKNVVTNKDPFTDRWNFRKRFTYTEVTLSLPKTGSGATQPSIDLSFITNSLLYAAATRVVCVSPQGVLISKDESNGKIKPLLVPDQSFSISRFEVSFFNTKTADRLDSNTFFPFPLASTLADIERRRCLDAVNIRVHIKRNGGPPGPDLAFDETILVNNQHAHRVPSCN